MATRKKQVDQEATAPDEDGEGPSARSFWSGTISFGLVTVPVDFYAAQRSSRVSLRMLSPDGTPLARKYFRPGDDNPLGPEDIERGYELDDGRIVPVSDEELERLLPEQSRDIDLRRFVDRDAVDPRYLDRAYLLAPSGSSTTAYRLLAEVMERARKVGIATFVMRGKQYVVAISAEGGLLRAETLRFVDELRTPEDMGLPEPVEPNEKTMKAVTSAIKAREKRDFSVRELEDTYGKKLQALVEAKLKKHEDVVTPPEEETGELGGGADVVDLVAVLRESLGRVAQESTKKRSSEPKARFKSATQPRKAAPKRREKRAKPSTAKAAKRSRKTAQRR